MAGEVNVGVPVREQYTGQAIRWRNRWRLPLMLALVLVWLPTAIYLSREIYVALAGAKQDFFWLPDSLFPNRGELLAPLMKFSYDLEYYSLALRRLAGIAAAVGLACSFKPFGLVTVTDVDAKYAGLRVTVRGAIYRWLGAILLLPSLAAIVVYHIAVAPEGIKIGPALAPALLVTADWLGLCEFTQWLVLRFRGRHYQWYFGWAALLATFFYFANYYLPQTVHWGEQHLFSAYSVAMNVFLVVFSLAMALWLQQSLATLVVGAPALIRAQPLPPRVPPTLAVLLRSR